MSMGIPRAVGHRCTWSLPRKRSLLVTRTRSTSSVQRLNHTVQTDGVVTDQILDLVPVSK
jgi:hypothetical protein